VDEKNQLDVIGLEEQVASLMLSKLALLLQNKKASLLQSKDASPISKVLAWQGGPVLW